MTQFNLKDAFGETPERVKECVRRSLQEEQRREPVVKRKFSVSLAIALAALLALSCVAYAAGQLVGIEGLYSLKNNKTGEVIPNEQAIAAMQELNQTYEGNAVRCTLNRALLDRAGGMLSLDWTLEKKHAGEQLYVVWEAMTLGGEAVHSSLMSRVTEYFLPDEASLSTFVGYLPETDSTELQLTLAVLRTEAEVVRLESGDSYEDRAAALLAEGKLPMAGDGVIEAPSSEKDMLSYADDLQATGLMEIVDRFTVCVKLDEVVIESARTLPEGTCVEFEGGEMVVESCAVSPTVSRLTVVFCTEAHPDAWERELPLFMLMSAGGEVWAPEMTGACGEAVQTEDGRWKTVVDIEANSIGGLYADALIFTPDAEFDDQLNLIWDEAKSATLELAE